MKSRFLAPLIACLGLPGAASACGDAFGKLDNHNPLWRAVLGIEFDNPVIKPGPMNDRCWLEEEFDAWPLQRAWIMRKVDKLTAVYGVPGVHIRPDENYSDEEEAYQFGTKTPLGKYVFRIALSPAADDAAARLRASLAGRDIDPPDHASTEKIETERHTGTAKIGGVEVELFTTHARVPARTWGTYDLYSSAAIFPAPANPDLLVIFLGDTNRDSVRLDGVRVEETLYQALRDIETADPTKQDCPFDYKPLSKQTLRVFELLGLAYDDEPIPADRMKRLCWGYDNVSKKNLARLEERTPAEGWHRTVEVRALTPDGARTGKTAFALSFFPWAEADANREKWRRDGAMKAETEERDQITYHHTEAKVNGLDVEIYTTHVDAPFLKRDSYISSATFRAPARPDLGIRLTGFQNEEWERLGGSPIERTFHDALIQLRPR